MMRRMAPVQEQRREKRIATMNGTAVEMTLGCGRAYLPDGRTANAGTSGPRGGTQ